MKRVSIRRAVAALSLACLALDASMAQETTTPPPAESSEQATPEVAPPPSVDANAEPAASEPAPPAEAAAEPAQVPSEPPAEAAEATDAAPQEPVAAEAPAPAPEAKPVWERCGVLYAPSAGAVASKVVEGEHVADLGDADAFVLPPGAPANVLAVQCARDAVMPEHNDYKVLLAGFPFSIMTKDDRVAVLDVSNGKVRLRMLQGSFTTEEQARLQDYLDEAQFAFDKAKLAAATKKKR